MRKLAMSAAVLAMVGGLTVGASSAAFAAGGPTNLNGKGCPASATNNISGGGYYLQERTSEFQVPNGHFYGDYKIYTVVGGVQRNYGTAEYSC